MATDPPLPRRAAPGNEHGDRRLASVVIDNYNYAAFVDRAIESALAQTWPHVEVVVVDDGSTDDSRAVIERYRDRITIVTKANGGQGSAVNAGFAASHGDLVCFLDADDELVPDAIARAAAALTTGVAKVHFRLEVIDAGGRPLRYRSPTTRERLGEGDVRDELIRRGRYVTPVMSGNVFARAALAEILPVPEDEFRLCADGYLVTAAPFAGRVAAVDAALGRYRVHHANRWSTAAVDADRLAALIDHDERKHAVIERLAAAEGRRARPGRGDAMYLVTCLARERLTGEPEQGRGRWTLVRLGLVASLTDRYRPARRRLKLAAWFAAIGCTPRSLALTAATMLFVPQRRSPWRALRFRAAARSTAAGEHRVGAAKAGGPAEVGTDGPDDGAVRRPGATMVLDASAPAAPVGTAARREAAPGAAGTGPALRPPR
jgi:GT2 family glycosyltransferase